MVFFEARDSSLNIKKHLPHNLVLSEEQSAINVCVLRENFISFDLVFLLAASEHSYSPLIIQNEPCVYPWQERR
jgi:hypothetical protein